MQKLNIRNNIKKIRVTDDTLYNLVMTDRRAAERYFGEYLEKPIITRYNLLHANNEYYNSIFPKLSERCQFSSSDVKDIVEWLMPSLTEVYFGSDDIVGIYGRGEQDDPSVLKKVIQYQMRNQNDSYNSIDQWCRDAVESGLGVIMMDWERKERKTRNWYSATFDEFYNLPKEAEQDIVKVKPVEDGSYQLLIKEVEVIKNQVVLKNVKPGEFIYLKDQNSDGRYMYEAWRRYVPFSEIVSGVRNGYYEKIDLKSFPFTDEAAEDSTSMNNVLDAIANYKDDAESVHDEYTAGSTDGQEARQMVVLYDHYGWYDVDGDNELEFVHVVTCNGALLKKEICVYDHSPFFTISFYANSYQRWKEAVADYLQCIQDIKTAIIRQLVINTSQNNNRQFAIDAQCTDGISDIIEGHNLIRVNVTNNKGINDFVKPMPQYPLEPATFQLLEMVSGWAEQKTGITKYNQGLDSDSLNKTATGIVKIMAASQQRLRKMARDGAENGIVPLYRHLIQLDKDNLTEDFTFRIAEKTYEFTPDDIAGDYDVQVTSNIGLQDKQLTIQNLMVILSQILPQLLQMGVARPEGVYNTAKQCVQEMGFTNASKYLGVSEEELAQSADLPNIIAQTLAGLGFPPEAIQVAVQNIMLAQQNPAVLQQQQQQMAQSQISQQEGINDGTGDGRIGYKDARKEAMMEMMR